MGSARELKLIVPGGAVELYTLRGEPLSVQATGKFRTRVAYAAAHVVLDPLRTADPVLAPAIDWDRTLAFREHLWQLGFGVAEAMDTAQRGMGLSWPMALELIQRSASVAKSHGAQLASGAGTDHLDAARSWSLDEITRAYEEQCAAVEAAGSRIILMASRALAKSAQTPEDYARVYGKILAQVREPVILHWLGPMFDPALAGYWGSADVQQAMKACLDVIAAHRAKVDGIKISLLDAGLEVAMRQRLPQGVKMYTGDDFHYDELIAGDSQGFSHALLGILAAIAPAASQALVALDGGDHAGYQRLLAPTLPLSRHIFQAPTYCYKTGIVFLAYLNGFQRHCRMLGGQESVRSITHLCELFRLADQARLLCNPELAVERMSNVLAQVGVA